VAVTVLVADLAHLDLLQLEGVVAAVEVWLVDDDGGEVALVVVQQGFLHPL
jgi:hypothetical protein